MMIKILELVSACDRALVCQAGSSFSVEREGDASEIFDDLVTEILQAANDDIFVMPMVDSKSRLERVVMTALR